MSYREVFDNLIRAEMGCIRTQVHINEAREKFSHDAWFQLQADRMQRDLDQKIEDIQDIISDIAIRN